ncbi:glycosyltransferase family 4 protein [Gelidibacter japonicus]|uniref:glycosyltransferase family 4 protein n=1 Tax=Gelidibacter japonicus TaxID=1962232 RepID=UPI003A8FCE18
MKLSLIHPFTPQAAGVLESSVATYHSQPHLKAMEFLAAESGHNLRMEYFTPKRTPYSFRFDSVNYVFHPVDFKWNGDHKKWKKQTSKKALKVYMENTPDVTIINMSGHSSSFSHELAKIIIENKRQYIAMLGGQHYSDTASNREYYRNANHILVHTQLQKKDMEEMEMFKGLDIRVFPLGVDCDVFKPSIHRNTSPKLLYVGRIVEWKRIHLVIEAVKMLKENGFPEATLKIIGPVFSEVYLRKLKKMISDNNLKHNIEIFSHKEHHELPLYFQEADLFTLPSDKETFGMVMIEAMACGTPVAGINCPGGPADVITHLENGLLSSPKKYSETILEYFKNENKMKEIAKNAREKALREYSIEATFKTLKNSVNFALSLNR